MKFRRYLVITLSLLFIQNLGFAQKSKVTIGSGFAWTFPANPLDDNFKTYSLNYVSGSDEVVNFLIDDSRFQDKEHGESIDYHTLINKNIGNSLKLKQYQYVPIPEEADFTMTLQITRADYIVDAKKKTSTEGSRYYARLNVVIGMKATIKAKDGTEIQTIEADYIKELKRIYGTDASDAQKIATIKTIIKDHKSSATAGGVNNKSINTNFARALAYFSAKVQSEIDTYIYPVSVNLFRITSKGAYNFDEYNEVVQSLKNSLKETVADSKKVNITAADKTEQDKGYVKLVNMATELLAKYTKDDSKEMEIRSGLLRTLAASEFILGNYEASITHGEAASLLHKKNKMPVIVKKSHYQNDNFSKLTSKGYITTDYWSTNEISDLPTINGDAAVELTNPDAKIVNAIVHGTDGSSYDIEFLVQKEDNQYGVSFINKRMIKLSKQGDFAEDFIEASNTKIKSIVIDGKTYHSVIFMHEKEGSSGNNTVLSLDGNKEAFSAFVQLHKATDKLNIYTSEQGEFVVVKDGKRHNGRNLTILGSAAKFNKNLSKYLSNCSSLSESILAGNYTLSLSDLEKIADSYSNCSE